MEKGTLTSQQRGYSRYQLAPSISVCLDVNMWVGNKPEVSFSRVSVKSNSTYIYAQNFSEMAQMSDEVRKRILVIYHSTGHR